MPSNCNCTDGPDGAQPAPPPTVGRPDPCVSQPETCGTYRVTIDEIEVLTTDDGMFEALQATFTFVVNGQSRVWNENSLMPGTWPIGITIPATVPNDTDSLELIVSGTENDPWPADDDPLPGFTRRWTRSDEWGVGPHVDSAVNSSISYRLHYTVSCARSGQVVMGRDQLMNMAQAKQRQRAALAGPGSPGSSDAQASAQVPQMSEQQQIAWSLNRLARSGLRLSHTTGQEFYFEGEGKPPQLKGS